MKYRRQILGKVSQGVMSILCFSLFLVMPVQAASFDCAKAGSAIEKLICADNTLSKLDSDLGKAYKQATSQGADKQQLINSQRQWLRDVRNVCQDSIDDSISIVVSLIL